jgi:hypothetical protein
MPVAVAPSEVRHPGSSRRVPACRPRTRPKPQATPGSVKTFVHDRLAEGERLDVKALTADYRAWCVEKRVAALELAGFLDEFETVCRNAGIAIEVGVDNRVYCLDVKLENAGAEPAQVH